MEIHIRNLSEAPSLISAYFVVQINFLYLTFDAKGGLISESLTLAQISNNEI